VLNSLKRCLKVNIVILTVFQQKFVSAFYCFARFLITKFVMVNYTAKFYQLDYSKLLNMASRTRFLEFNVNRFGATDA